ncbi:TetR/AcrR family transcriptional regulator [Reichenbachiella agarivorans]|uniref:TetR/AcrR family transcriptional regulator n=1 Tax=Reichenbachiella agarivorans TaxID=2979464 RepID=A0ABY6CSE9_9BACT|nr:TetR/AcrR family transcriptional regulator [Reichenbachiella agarivorans]UXP33446.1 TetR/AcrR family transcriptional regulator [Reichenbachiella agarivorans]
MSEDTTESKIKEAAESLFAKYGLKGTTIRKVAEKAGVNIALVNYYFRSKEKLFLSVFEEKLKIYTEMGIGILTDRKRDIWSRIRDYVDEMINAMMKESNLPIFIMSETHFNPNLITQIKSFSKEEMRLKSQKIQTVLDEELEKGNIRKVDAIDFECTLTSMMIFPFLTKNILKHTGRLDEDFNGFDGFLEHNKSNVIFAITNFLKKD